MTAEKDELAAQMEQMQQQMKDMKGSGRKSPSGKKSPIGKAAKGKRKGSKDIVEKKKPFQKMQI